MNRPPTFGQRLALRAAALLGLLLQAPAALALDYQLHGFAAQGYSLSEHNNYFGDSTHGSTDFYELGLNATVPVTPNLLISAQGLLRRAGNTDTEGLRLDYAQIDDRLLSTGQYNVGLRLGRVKNPFGFYNETRDVVFTRPGITLPDSIYLEAEGLRSSVFSSDGIQLYGGAQLGEHYLSLEGNYTAKSRLSDAEEKEVFGQVPLPFKLQLEHFHVARLQDEWNGGTVKAAVSYLHARLTIEPDPGVPIGGFLTANIWVASLRYNARYFALTGEYQLTQTRFETTLSPTQNTAGDGFYLQAEYHFLPKWTVMTRYDASFADRHDRDGRTFASLTGGDRYGQFQHNETIGLNWQPTEHWGAWAEFHLIQGTSRVPASDNVGRTLSDQWNLFQLMAAYRF
jgi:hypothetical protein